MNVLHLYRRKFCDGHNILVFKSVYAFCDNVLVYYVIMFKKRIIKLKTLFQSFLAVEQNVSATFYEILNIKSLNY